MPRGEERFEVRNPLGLHARAAARLVRLASRFRADIELEKDGRRVNAKSVMGVLLLCGAQGSVVTVRAEGPDAMEALRAIGDLFASGFGELT